MIKTKIIKRTEISIDGGTQQRESINQSIVAEYAEAMRCGVKFPSVTVFFDGAQYWLADGFHRLHAHEAAGIDQISCDVHDGTNRQAQLFSFGVNGAHGLRLTNADKRKSVLGMLSDKEWSTWPNREIARHCNVSHQLVNKIKDELEVSSSKVSQVATVATETVAPTQPIESKETVEQDQEFQDCAPTEVEIAASVKAEAEQNEYIKNVLSQDEPLAQALADVKRYKEAARIAKERMDGLLNEKSELIRMIKSLQAKLKKAGIK